MKKSEYKIHKEINVKSPANIAFIKYWGQKDKKIILPYNDSFSMNLSSCFTLLKIQIVEDISIQRLFIKDYGSKEFVENSETALNKIKEFYKRAKKFLGAKNDIGFIIYSENSFPKNAGIASSASFFSTLALAFSHAFEKKLSEKQLSILARLSGSGSACRSIPDGFVWWSKGTDTSNSFSKSIAPSKYWDLVDLVLLLTFDEKKVSSSEGHQKVESSPYFQTRQKDVNKRLKAIKKAFLIKNFKLFGNLLEQEAISMHAIMMTQNPPLFFWGGSTIEIIKKTIELRESGIEAYFTIDAGENVHIICERKNKKKIYDYFKKQNEVKKIIVNYPTIGGRIITIKN